MADRQKRKARRRVRDGRPAGAAGEPTPPPDTRPGPRGTGDGSQDGMRRGYARAEARNQAARDALVPLGPGERPRPLVVGVAFCAAVAAANLGLALYGYATDTEIARQEPGTQSLLGAVAFSTIIGAAGLGMWRGRYWALLGFQALLAITVIAMALTLLRATNLLAVIPLAVALLGGWLFWKNVNVMARMQKRDRIAQGRED